VGFKFQAYRKVVSATTTILGGGVFKDKKVQGGRKEYRKPTISSEMDGGYHLEVSPNASTCGIPEEGRILERWVNGDFVKRMESGGKVSGRNVLSRWRDISECKFKGGLNK